MKLVSGLSYYKIQLMGNVKSGNEILLPALSYKEVQLRVGEMAKGFTPAQLAELGGPLVKVVTTRGDEIAGAFLQDYHPPFVTIREQKEGDRMSYYSLPREGRIHDIFSLA